MATSKRSRKIKMIKYFNYFIKPDSDFGRRWFMLHVIHANTLSRLFFREVRTPRMKAKCIETVDCENIKHWYGKWMCPNVITNPCRKSRIKNYVSTYQILEAEKVPARNGTYPYTQETLMNYYLANCKNEE